MEKYHRGEKREHRQFTLLIDRFNPITEQHKRIIDRLLKEDKNILIMICKIEGEQEDDNIPTQEERFQKICELYPKGTLEKGSIILSTVPDVTELVHGPEMGYDVRRDIVFEERDK